MKGNIFSVILLCAALAMSSGYGCGGSKDESKEAAPAPAEIDKAAGADIGQPAGGTGADPENAGRAMTPEPQPAVKETDSGQPAEILARKAEQAEVAGATADEPGSESGQHSKDDGAAPGKAESAGPAEMQTAAQAAADVVTIENHGYAEDRKGPVKFSHLKHNTDYKVSCDQCHHLYMDSVNQWKKGDHVDKCIVCHNPLEDKDKTVKLQNAFHKNCRDCHSSVNREGKEAPSAKCSDCHG